MMFFSCPRIIACATVAEELSRLGVPPERMTTLEFGLHEDPPRLKEKLQAEIDAVEGDCDILLGYGLCSNAAVGLGGGAHRLVIPRADDCIALFLGSREAHLEALADEPGTYYLTKGWVEAADGALKELQRLIDRYGLEKAVRVSKAVFANYTRVVLIDTGNYEMERYRNFARTMAGFLGLRFEELAGSNRLLSKMLEGRWDEEFVVVEPGLKVEAAPFARSV